MPTAWGPQTGTAGDVAIEAFAGILAGNEGAFAFRQCGSMHDSQQLLTYEMVPGSGTRDLAGLTGTVRLTRHRSSAGHLSWAGGSVVGVGSGKVTPVSCSDSDQSRRPVAGSWAAATACTSMGAPRVSWKPEGP